MSRFCTRCGRPLQDGEICSCQMMAGQMQQQTAGQQVPYQQQTAGQQPQYQQQTAGQQIQYQQAASGFAKKLVSCFLSLVKSPVTAGRQLVAEADMKIAFVLLALQGVMSGFFAMAVGKRCYSYILALTGLVDGYTSGAGTAAAGMLTMPYGRMFIVTVLLSVGLSCLMALLLWVGHMILKCNVTYPQMLSAAAIRSAVLIPSILVSILLFEINSFLGIMVFLLSNIWAFAAMLLTMNRSIPVEGQDRFALVVSTALLVFVLVMMFVLSKAWTFYLPDVIRSGMSGSGNLTDLLKEVF